MKDIKFVILIILIFFGAGIMANINDYDYNVNKTGIMYQENDNIVLNENNRFYDYDIDFNLDESYLQYSPVKKSGLLDSLYNDKSKNLAIPDLTGKDYLGVGVYRLYNQDNRTLDYNIYNGVFTFNGTINSGDNVRIPMGYVNGWVQGTSYTSTINVLTSNAFIGDTRFENHFINTGGNYSPYWVQNLRLVLNGGFRTTTFSNQNNNTINLRLRKVSSQSSATFNDWQFTLQIEKGTTATSYQVPYIPALQIAFNGTNQVEYINPFEEHIIEIDDINNVNNIDFQLLNTKNPVVFNWNITTNPNMPFVRFYNNQTKLLYDFTDINEINKIGNEILGSHSNFMIVFESAIDTVDMFYSGFQKLFNRNLIETIKNSLKRLWPIITPNWPWLR